MDVRSFTIGPVQENCYLVRRDGSDHAVIFDPGEEPDRLLNSIERLGLTLDAILLTHTHFDHVGAVAPVARETGAEVWVPELERGVLADINSYVPFPELGPFESYEAEHTLIGGERLELADLEIDVLFQGSVGRVDFPGGDGPTLLASIASLVDALPPETAVYPGHMGITTLGAERASNPFLAELAG
jgi:glyoxylase-like metal-dependent hydrolase (beta-lactamase superfamily II)